uniref:RxLR effector protein n=1 Tax=Phytophthora sojae TaxID=67593 RepID=C0LF24_PHYSO|nr:avirulence effector protein Avr3c [Phytophthora sojae]
MRVCSVLLVAAAALIATSNAVEPSATSTVEVAEVQARGADKRFLRSLQTEEEQGDSDVNEAEDGSEERGLFAWIKNAVTGDVLLAKANKGDFEMQTKLFKKWIEEKPKVRQNAIAKIMRDGGRKKYDTVLTAWMNHDKRTANGIGIRGATNDVDELLPGTLIYRAAAGDTGAQGALFSIWIGAEKKTVDTARIILSKSEISAKEYKRLNKAWVQYRRKHK